MTHVALSRFDENVVRPSVLAETDQFIIKLAEDDSEIEEAFRLRYNVFNLEQGKGLRSAEKSGMDSDEFDEDCLHLLVIEKASRKVIGTYRVHLGSVALASKGFYSAREFSIGGLETIASSSMELGRSCVAADYRTGSVVALLWSGIAELLTRAKLRYLLGCVSIEDTRPETGWSLYRCFLKSGLGTDLIHAKPKSKCILPPADEDRVAEMLESPRQLLRQLPPLFKGYLRVGCKICGKPALDREFGTVDFLIIVDTKALPERYKRHFRT